MMSGAGMGMGGFWVVVVFLLVVVVGVVAVIVMRGERGEGHGHPSPKEQVVHQGTARDVIELRYARGEITAAEMRTMLDDLGSNR
ncbi:MAG: hypothetical protein INR66_02635 [Gordonia polyisoprenivorans]|nr:hypothetical protein [Gordonia polyisoprenivorans]